MVSMANGLSIRRGAAAMIGAALLVGTVGLAGGIGAIPAHAAGNEAASSASLGVWRNPGNSVHIRIAPCGGDRVCGTVTWASEKAKADARKGGTASLVGTDLFREFRRIGPNQYKGRVFVPDMNRTFSGQMRIEGNALHGKGCVLGLICKSQTWTRIS